MRFYMMVVASSALLAGCAPIEHTQAIVEPAGQVRTVPVGGAVASINKQKNLPNVFGASDIYGRRVDTGYIKIVYHGVTRDGGILLRQTDVDIHSNASVLTRMPSTYSEASSASIHGNASGGQATVTGSAHGSTFAMAPHAETNVVLPPNVTEFVVPKGKTLTLSTGQVVEFIEAESHQVSYRIVAPKR